MSRFKSLVAVLLLSSLIATGCASSKAPPFPSENEGGAPAEQQIRERFEILRRNFKICRSATATWLRSRHSSHL
jgi:hypothetical protein